MDYTLPHADQLPSFRDEIVEVLSPTNPYGIKAGGEGGTTPALAVIVSAILGALAPLGIRDVSMPATPYAIWRAIQKSKEGLNAAPSTPPATAARCVLPSNRAP
jgi:carbon-monoxide dehydrogenase large subunit